MNLVELITQTRERKRKIILNSNSRCVSRQPKHFLFYLSSPCCLHHLDIDFPHTRLLLSPFISEMLTNGTPKKAEFSSMIGKGTCVLVSAALPNKSNLANIVRHGDSSEGQRAGIDKAQSKAKDMRPACVHIQALTTLHQVSPLASKLQGKPPQHRQPPINRSQYCNYSTVIMWTRRGEDALPRPHTTNFL